MALWDRERLELRVAAPLLVAVALSVNGALRLALPTVPLALAVALLEAVPVRVRAGVPVPLAGTLGVGSALPLMEWLASREPEGVAEAAEAEGVAVAV